MKKSLIPLLLALLATPALADKLPVLASFSILADLTREVGGERVDVASLVGPDQDAHVFQPAPQDVKKLAAAKVFVVNGLGFEGWLSRLSKSSGFKGQTVVASQGVKAQDMAEEEHDHHRPPSPQVTIAASRQRCDAEHHKGTGGVRHQVFPAAKAEVDSNGADGGSEDQQRQVVNGVGEVEQQAGGHGASLGHGSRRGRCRFRIRRRRWGD